MIRVSMRQLAIAAGVTLGALVMSPADAQAQCSISTTPVAFGNYNPLSTAPVVTTGTVTYQCLLSVLPVVTLSRGASTTFTPRTLKKGAESLEYNLFRDAAYATVWGDGTGGTQSYTAVAALLFPVNLTVYARILPGQNVSAGAFSDSVVATIIF